MIALVIIVGIVTLLMLWIALAPVELVVDTRVPIIYLRLVSIGMASVEFDNENCLLHIQILFIRFCFRTEQMRSKKKKPAAKPRTKKETNSANLIRKMLRLMKTVRVKQFELQLKPADYTLTARLYPLNFIRLPDPYIFSVSLNEEAYLAMKISTVPWRIAYALIRK